MTIALRPYPAYKDPGIAWLGGVPAHWGIQRLKRLARLNPSKAEIGSADASLEVTFVPMEKVSSSGSIDTSLTRPLGDVRNGFTYFRQDDVILAKITPCFENGKSAIARGLRNGIGFGSTEFHVLRSSEKVLPDFLYRLVSFSDFLSLGEEHMEGAAGQKRVPADFVANFQIPLPPLDEQRAIADFLDGMDARISRFIAAKRRMIALLEEKKQAVINQAVTRGLDPDVPLKDSGVDWLGEIPAHWEVRRVKSLARFITSGSRDRAAHYSDTGAVFLRIGNLSTTSVDMKLTNIQHVQPPAGAEGERTRVLPGDVLISITAQMGAVGLVPEGLGEAYINQHTALIRLSRATVWPRWVAYCLLSDLGKRQSEMRTNGGTKQGLGLDDVASLAIFCPSIDEQKAIVEHIDREATRIDAVIYRGEREIELIKEYRTRLISDVVTGKLDVRGWELPEVEEAVDAGIEATLERDVEAELSEVNG